MRNRGAVLLLRTGRTQREIATRLAARGQPVTHQAVWAWRLGEKKPSRARRRALALEFGIPVAAWDQPPGFVPPAWRTDWRSSRRELRLSLRLRLALATV